VSVERLGDRQLLWVDIVRDDDDDPIDGVVEPLSLDRRSVKRLQANEGRARLRRAEDRLNLTLEALELDDRDPPRLAGRELQILAGPNLVVTAHVGELEALRQYVADLDGESRIGALDSADLLSSLTDEVIGGYFRVAEMLERDIDRLDERALRADPDDDILADIVALRRRISLVRRVITPHRDALAAFGRPEMRVEELVGVPWSGLGDRLERAIDSIEVLRQGLLGTYDIYMGRTSQRGNDVMRVLTLVSALFLPSLVVAGIMGMNFRVGFFDQPGNFFIVLALMVAMGVGLLLAARWRRWL
jgi:magnesium transporter